jgi:hypothetical protein
MTGKGFILLNRPDSSSNKSSRIISLDANTSVGGLINFVLIELNILRL